jgi:DivIVA domain-containing protein
MDETTSALTAEDVRGTTFDKPPWGKRGYDEKSVNDFLQLVARRLEGRGHLSAADVRGMRFPKPSIASAASTRLTSMPSWTGSPRR